MDYTKLVFATKIGSSWHVLTNGGRTLLGVVTENRGDVTFTPSRTSYSLDEFQAIVETMLEAQEPPLSAKKRN